MTMQLVFGNITITIKSIYPDTQLLQFTINKQDIDLSTLSEIENYTGVIDYLEDGISIARYKDYTGKFEYLYSSDSYLIKMYKIDAIDLEIQNIKSTADMDRAYVDAVICELTMLATLI